MKLFSSQVRTSLAACENREAVSTYNYACKYTLGVVVFAVITRDADSGISSMQLVIDALLLLGAFLLENKRFFVKRFGCTVTFGNSLVTIKSLFLSYQFGYSSIADVSVQETESLRVFTFKSLSGWQILPFHIDNHGEDLARFENIIKLELA